MTDNTSLEFELNLKHAIAGVFLLGIMTGFTASSLVGGLTSQTDSGDIQQIDTGNNDHQMDDAQPSGSETVDVSSISAQGEPVLGESDAPVTVYMYEDYQCPFCQQFEQGAVPQIVSNYVDSGQVKLVWKDLPLPQIGHEWAEPAAAAMECVYREGGNDAFWNVKDQVFNNQGSISLNNVEDQIKSYASQEGVSSSAVQSCIDNDNPMEEVNGDTQEASQVGANGTPTSIIGGEKVVGAQPFDQIQPVIERQLNG
jgi:protein-disulfide isomerase